MKKNLPVILSAIVVLAFGCGKKAATYETSDGQVKIVQQGDTAKYEVKTKDGTATMTANQAGVTIPDTFPKDVPILKGAIPRMTMSQGKTEILHLHVPGTIAAVAKDYQDKLKDEGWEIAATMNMGESSMVQAKKANRQCVAVVAKDDDGTMVQLSVNQD